MAYHVELKGVPLSSRQSDTSAYVIQGSVSIETAVAERPTAALVCARAARRRSRSAGLR